VDRTNNTARIMEFSSPLAAMQPPPRPRFGCGAQDMASRTLFPSMNGYSGGNPFNFGEMATSKKSGGDYFNVKPIRGSSPAASLAADLSQNFHIDQRYEARYIDLAFLPCSSIGALTSLPPTARNSRLPVGRSSLRTATSNSRRLQVSPQFLGNLLMSWVPCNSWNGPKKFSPARALHWRS
jgi:hypothetical protein